MSKQIKNPYLTKSSLPSMMRRRRFKVINELISGQIALKGSCRILDIGGTEYYWALNSEFIAAHSGKIRIVLVNYGDPADVKLGNDYVDRLSGDATKPDVYGATEFDLIHSNSVIEHVGAWPAIRSMANCILATGKPFYLQTPNYWFPIEPHFRFVGWHWLPESWRAALLMRGRRGFRGQSATFDEAMGQVESVKLLTGRQLRALFPGSEIRSEWFGPLIKSFMVIQSAAKA